MPAKREVVGLWPCFYATIRLLCHCLQELFFCHIVRSDDIDIFSVTSRGCELLASRAMTMHDNLFYVVSQWANNNNNIFYCIACASKWASDITWYCKERASARCIAMIKRFYCHLREKRSIFFTSYCKKRRQQAYFYIISQKVMT